MEKTVAAFPASSFEAIPPKKYLPVMHTTWDPAIVALGRLEVVCPELMPYVVNQDRDVDQLKGFLVDVQAQTLMIDRIELEAERNGQYDADTALKTNRGVPLEIEGPVPREDSEGRSAAPNDGAWKGPYKQQMEEAFSAALDLVPPIQPSHAFPSPSYATRWHDKRREDIMRQFPEVAMFCKSHSAFPLSILIGLLAAALNCYTIAIYVPRVIFRTMLATGPAKQSLLESFTVSSMLGHDVGLLCYPLETLVTFLSPFAVMANWMETHLADTYKVISLTALVVHLFLLAAVWGWWTNTAAYVMTCEVMMETVGPWFAADTKPARHRWAQQVKFIAKHVLTIAMNPMAISGVAFEHALLGYKGHVEHLATGEVLQGHQRLVTGISTHLGHVDGSLSLPHHLLMQQRRWKTVIKDKFGVAVHRFPQELLGAARLRHFVSRQDLLREESRLLEHNGQGLGPGITLLDSGKMEDYIQEETAARQAAAEARNSLEIEFGPQKRAMNKVMLFAKEFYYSIRGASFTDLRLLAGRANFQVTDPRPLQTVIELVHPALNVGAYSPFNFDIVPLLRPYPVLTLCARDSCYLAVYCGMHLFEGFIALAPMSIGLSLMAVLATLQHLPGYRHTIGKFWDACGARYMKDNTGMYLSVEGCLLFTRRAAGLMWQGLRYCTTLSLWMLFVFWAAKEAVNVRSLQEHLGYSSWTIGAFVLMLTASYEALAELFALGFLWHPMWFVHATGHLTVEQSTQITTSTDASTTSSSEREWSQPSVSLYSDALFWLSFGQTHHVEQHDFPRLPWVHRAQLRLRAAPFYNDQALFSHVGLLHAAKTYTNSKGNGVYAAQNEK